MHAVHITGTWHLCILIRDSNRFDSIHLTNRFELIWFPQKSDSSIRPQLGVCMQYLTVTVVLSMVQQQAQSQEKWASRYQFVPSLPHFSSLNSKLNRFESVFWCESNRIEIGFGELEYTTWHRTTCAIFTAYLVIFIFDRSLPAFRRWHLAGDRHYNSRLLFNRVFFTILFYSRIRAVV